MLPEPVDTSRSTGPETVSVRSNEPCTAWAAPAAGRNKATMRAATATGRCVYRASHANLMNTHSIDGRLRQTRHGHRTGRSHPRAGISADRSDHALLPATFDGKAPRGVALRGRSGAHILAGRKREPARARAHLLH